MTVNEISSEWRIFLVREKEVPGGTHANVVVAVAVPVVDEETVRIEVANVDEVAVVGIFDSDGLLVFYDTRDGSSSKMGVCPSR